MKGKRKPSALKAMDADLAAQVERRLARIRQASTALSEASAAAHSNVRTQEIIEKLAEAGAPARRLDRIKAAISPASRENAQDAVQHRRAEIARLNGEGLNDRQIAKAVGMTRPHVCKLRRMLGIPAVGRRND